MGHASDANRAISLRYFNPVGAHKSGLIGESPQDLPNNLMPLIVRVAQENNGCLDIYGADYETRDGTGERITFTSVTLLMLMSRQLKK